VSRRSRGGRRGRRAKAEAKARAIARAQATQQQAPEVIEAWLNGQERERP